MNRALLAIFLSVVAASFLTTGSNACAIGPRGYDVGEKTADPTLEGTRRFIGRVIKLQLFPGTGRTQAIAKFEVLRNYSLGKHSKRQIAAQYRIGLCGQKLELGQIGTFAIRTKDGRNTLISVFGGG